MPTHNTTTMAAAAAAAVELCGKTLSLAERQMWEWAMALLIDLNATAKVRDQRSARAPRRRAAPH